MIGIFTVGSLGDAFDHVADYRADRHGSRLAGLQKVLEGYLNVGQQIGLQRRVQGCTIWGSSLEQKGMEFGGHMYCWVMAFLSRFPF